jgi:hypothetical protein
MRKVQQQAIDSGFLDLLGTDTGRFEEPKMEGIEKVLFELAKTYAELIREKLDKVDAASSGNMADSIAPTEVEFDGKVYSVGVEAVDYMSYVDAGVNGWAKNRGSVYSFRKKGVPDTMLQSIKAYLNREGNSSRNVKVGISARETKGIDALTRDPKQVAFMIKRQGIAPKKFFTDATKEMQVVIKDELGAALRIDIINNIIK